MRKTAIILASAAFLVACGGGGDSSTTTTTAGPAAPISAANQEVVARDALGTSFQLFDSAASSPMASAAVATPDEGALMQLARAEMAKLPTYLANAPKVLGAAQATVPADCANGGTFVVTANDADNSGNGVTAGDSVSIAFNNCVTGTQTANGTLGFNVDSMTGPFGSYPYAGQLTMSFGNLSLTGSGYSLSANGSVTLSTAVNGTNSISESLSAPSFTASASYAGVTRSRSLNGYVLVHDRTPVGASYEDSYEGGGTVTGSNTLASVTVSFITPNATRFIRRAGESYPYTGQMTLTGMNNSRLRITAVDNLNVQLEVDADGNGIYEGSNTVPWITVIH